MASTAGGGYRVEKIRHGADWRRAVHLYIPHSAGTSPLLPRLAVFVHGGAWVSESVQEHERLASYIASNANIVVALIEYRLSGKEASENHVRHPDHLHDVFAGLRFLFDEQNAQRFRYTTEAAILVGHSAGAHMALAVALDSAARQSQYPAEPVRSIEAPDELPRICKSIKTFVCVEPIVSLVDMLALYPSYSYFTTPAFYNPTAGPQPPYAELEKAGIESWPLRPRGSYHGDADTPSVLVVRSQHDSLLSGEYVQRGVSSLVQKGINVQFDPLAHAHEGDHGQILQDQAFLDSLIALSL